MNRRLKTFSLIALFPVLVCPGCACGNQKGSDAGDLQQEQDAYQDMTDHWVGDAPCPDGRVLCDGSCVDLSSSHSNCGACGHDCLAQEVCALGQCSLECPGGYVACGGACLEGMDHGGSDLAINSDQTLSGRHGGVGLFLVASGAAVKVEAFSPDQGNSGWIEICAREILIDGTIDASGSGCGGGGGGGGGAANLQAGPGGGGAGTCAGENGAGGENPDGGMGGRGGGDFAGAGGEAGAGRGVPTCNERSEAAHHMGGDGTDGGNGGYMAVGGNGDSSMNESVFMGSGGAGGGGGGAGTASNCCEGFLSGGGGGGGGAGNRGGGLVILRAAGSVTVSGSILAVGLDGATGNGQYAQAGPTPRPDGGTGGGADTEGASVGGSGGLGEKTRLLDLRPDDPGCQPCEVGCPEHLALCDAGCLEQVCCYTYLGGYGGPGGDGGGGGGGGILIAASSVVIEGAQINALGGGESEENGGTLKVFALDEPGDPTREFLTQIAAAGRVLLCVGDDGPVCSEL